MTRVASLMLSATILGIALFLLPQFTVCQSSAPKKAEANSGNTDATQHSDSLSRRRSKETARLRRKYGLESVGHRGIGSGMNFYSMKREQRLGRELSEKIDSSVTLVDDPLLVGYLNHIGEKLVATSDSPRPFTVKLVNDYDENAVAIPGRVLYITTGLVLFCDDEAELASVIAHELGHIEARHGTKQLSKQRFWQFASVPMMAGGIPIGAVMQMITGATVQVSLSKVGRSAEYEADLLAVEYNYLAGYDPDALSHLLEKSEEKTTARNNIVSKIFASHPDTEDRVQRLRFEADELLPPKDQYVVDTSEFQEMKKRLVELLKGSKSSVAKDDVGNKLRTNSKLPRHLFLGRIAVD